MRSVCAPQATWNSHERIVQRRACLSSPSEGLERLEAKRFGKTAAPRREISDADTTPRTRHVPAAVRRAVRERDADRCRFVDEQGRRCSERHRLEFHHRHPFGTGGDHSLGNISLLCPAHNRYMAERDYGVAASRQRRTTRRMQPPLQQLLPP
jgi:hypothetical protein